jgi:hypothetical protein
MGYSGRYHAASLAAVFLALAIGILIGVGLGHNVISSTRKGLEQSLKGNLSDARSHADTLQAELNRERDFSEQIFPGLVDGILRGNRVAVVALGTLPDGMKGPIQAVVGPDNPTGAVLGEVAIVREPPDLKALAAAGKPPTSAKRLARNPDALSGMYRRMGRALVTGARPFHSFRGAMLSRISGHPGGIDAVIVVRSQPANLNASRSAATTGVETALLQGLEQAAGPVVGVERSDSDPSSIGFLSAAGTSATVDSIDLVSGRTVLAYALDGADGNYGIKATADRLLPALRQPVPTAAARGHR